MTQLQTYTPARLAAAYSPNRPGWPLAVCLTLVIGQSAMTKPLATRPTAVRRPVYSGAGYAPQCASTETGGDALPEQEAFLEEVSLPAMPKRSYQIKMHVQQVEKGRLRM